MALTDKQIRFCEEYLIDLNATQAAIRAGYSEKTAHSIGAENLTKPEIQTCLQERQKQLQQKTGITQERVLQEYARIAFNDIRRYYDENGRLLPVHELDEDAAAALAGVEVDELWGVSMDGKVQIGETKKIKRWDKVKALDSLGKHLGLFEADNEQRKPNINLTNLGTDELKQMLELVKKANSGR